MIGQAGALQLSRRAFIGASGAASVAGLVVPGRIEAADRDQPWYQRAHRWAQTNISRKDVADYDVDFWRHMCRQTAAQVVITNGAAGFATFRSRNPLISTSPDAPDRDLLGEIVAGARADQMSVAARMDSSVLNPKIIEAYPNWLTRDAAGTPGHVMCINSPYRQTLVYPLYREIIERYRVDGFTDNAGVTGGPLCFCGFCRDKFGRDVGGALPARVDLDDPRYRDWVRWNAGVTMAAWEETNAVTRSAGGPDCIYIGLVRKFAPLNREIARRADILLMDCQSRNDSASFQEHADDGRFMGSLLGWDKTIAVAASMTQHSHGYFRLTSEPPAEVGLYLKSGLSGGFKPWWHYPTACSDDDRSYAIPAPVFQWYARSERALLNGNPIVAAAIVYSDDNAQFFGRDAPGLYQPGAISDITQIPYRGMSRALSDKLFPYMPVHVRDLGRHQRDVPLLILPNVGGLSAEECAVIRDYVKSGGALFATGMTSLFDEDGEPRTDFALADVLGATLVGSTPERTYFSAPAEETYFEFAPGARHPALDKFRDVDLLAYGGPTLRVKVASDRQIPLWTWSQMGAPGVAALVLGTYGAGRVAFMPVAPDRHYLIEGNPDIATLLSGVADWCVNCRRPVTVEGPGCINPYLYHRDDTLVLHLLNGSGIYNGEQMTGTIYAQGPISVSVRLPHDIAPTLLALNGRTPTQLRVANGLLSFTIDRIEDHQVIVIG